MQADWVGVAIRWVERGVGPELVRQLIGTVNSHLLESSQLLLGHETAGRITDISTVHFIIFFHLHKLQVNNMTYSEPSCYWVSQHHSFCLLSNTCM